MNATDAVEAARRVAQHLATDRFRRDDARLYSQHSRLKYNQPGLLSWTDAETDRRLQDALLLIHMGGVIRELAPARTSEWRACLRRAGELLEWIGHGQIVPDGVPATLLAAAAYGLAGYPALAEAVFRDAPKTDDSEILTAFLRGDFATAQSLIAQHWEKALPPAPGLDPTELPVLREVINETIRAIGVICAALRWGDESRTEVALRKLDHVCRVCLTDYAPYSWLLARLTREVSATALGHSWRGVLDEMQDRVDADGRTAFDRYSRAAFIGGRTLAWPSQEEGVRRLLKSGSFALCTPTGSGKTSVAEIAILQAIVGTPTTNSTFAPICLYLVPSRALAAEVEAKMHRVLRPLTSRRVIVTGLYGGTDWGPTDAWLTADDPTILICTYEKAEALVRFIGPLFVGRLSLVVFDEAHSVQFAGSTTPLRSADSRPLRLESLGMRLRQMTEGRNCRFIALSAVAHGLENALQHWVAGDDGDSAVTVTYRSTRQLVGRLICPSAAPFQIHYDLLDGHPLRFQGDGEASPYVREALPQHPPATSSRWTGVEKSLRPAILWAALHFAAPDDRGHRHAVLVSVTQNITTLQEDFLYLFEREWNSVRLPGALVLPNDNKGISLWQKCLEIYRDYFGEDSFEFRLLNYGIVVHHGDIPRALTTILIDIVQRGICWIVVATSTLSEGVNIPVETIILPTLQRSGRTLPVAEFRNIAGRAGRPGVATEGRTLVALPPGSRTAAHNRYDQLIRDYGSTTAQMPNSPIANVISDLWTEWQLRFGNRSQSDFLAWLEKVTFNNLNADEAERFGSLDSLDGLLLAANVEWNESPRDQAWEERAQELWNRSFAAHQASELQRLGFVSRATAIPRIYPGTDYRRKLYRTGLPPKTANEVLRLYETILAVLAAGAPYSGWSQQERLEYVVAVIGAVGQIKRFRPREITDWKDILRWWLVPASTAWPRPKEISGWHKAVRQDFGYRFCWGLGSIIAIAVNQVNPEILEPSRLEDWEKTGLPWVVFWLKELITWGTLEPVAAFLLSRALATTRQQAEQAAQAYYESQFAQQSLDPLDARQIRDWAESTYVTENIFSNSAEPRHVPVTITDDAIATMRTDLRVFPVRLENATGWIDAAGYHVAETDNTAWTWHHADRKTLDFVLQPMLRRVAVRPYF